MSMMKEFKDFAIKGNVVDMAVGIIIGAAFGKIVSAFVNGVIMPPLGLMMGGVNFADLKHVIQEANGDVVEVAIKYGEFVQTVIDFAIVALAVFMAVKVINGMKKKEEAAPAKPAAKPAQEVLLEEIRDALKKAPAKPAAAKKPAAKRAPAKKAPAKKK